MGLTNPPVVATIAGELNTPDDGTGNHDFDTWYDINSDDVTATKTAVLATLGLSYAAGVFTTLRRGVWSVQFDWEINPTPGGACNLQFVTSSYVGGVFQQVANPNTLGTLRDQVSILALQAGDTFRSTQTCTNGTDVPLTYMDMAIIRIV